MNQLVFSDPSRYVIESGQVYIKVSSSIHGIVDFPGAFLTSLTGGLSSAGRPLMGMGVG